LNKTLNNNLKDEGKQFNFDPKTIEEKLDNARRMNSSIKETFIKIKNSTEKINKNSNISLNNTETNLKTIDIKEPARKNKYKFYELNKAAKLISDKNQKIINRNKNLSTNYGEYHDSKPKNLKYSQYNEKEKTNLNDSIETYQGSFNTELKNPNNPYAKLLKLREEKIDNLFRKNSDFENEICILKREKNSLIKAIDTLINKFNPPRNSNILKNESQ